MKPIARILIPVIGILAAAGCAGHKKMSSPDGVKMSVPDWYLHPPRDENRLVGLASAVSVDMQTSVDKAKQDARADIASQLDLRLDGLTKRFVEETGLGPDAELLDNFSQVTKSVFSESLIGSRVSRQELRQEGGVYRAYIMMEIPMGEANARMLDRIMERERLYTRFRATEAYQELDEEVQRYEDWKRDQPFLDR